VFIVDVIAGAFVDEHFPDVVANIGVFAEFPLMARLIRPAMKRHTLSRPLLENRPMASVHNSFWVDISFCASCGSCWRLLLHG
jgi:hypothetical protein